MDKDSYGRTLEDKCSQCKSNWSKDWARCQRCGNDKTVEELIRSTARAVKPAAPKKPAYKEI